MAHPQMFDDDDPLLARVHDLAMRLPGAQRKTSHGRPTFFTTKVFAYYGGTLKGEHGHDRHDHSLLVLLEPDEREALLDEERCYSPAYLGPSGWLGVDLDGPGADPDWDEVGELLDASFRRTAPARLVAELEQRAR